jgi:hypothetical protein
MDIFSRALRRAIRPLGWTLVRCHRQTGLPPDIGSEDATIIHAVAPYTKTSFARVQVLLESVRYTVRTGIPGAFVEAGVWRGGSMMAVAYALIALGETNRDLYLYDTYTGMSTPTEKDVSRKGYTAQSKFAKTATGKDSSTWCLASVEDVRANMERTGYPMDRVHFIAGKVEDTIPAQTPEQIALLRLDTDWYESTRHELQHLYPRLAENAALIIDDYGDWLGARKAVDEFLAVQPVPLFLHRIDDTGRLIIKRTRL